MRDVIDQLETLRRRGAALLLAQRLAAWAAAVLAGLLLLAAGDYLIRLPGWMRMIVGVAGAGAAMAWIVRHAVRALGFAPDLGALALRAERLYPQLAGTFASGVEFAAHPDRYSDPERTGLLAQSAVHEAQRRLKGVSLGKLIDPASTYRLLLVAGFALALFTGSAFAAGDLARIAAQRWFLPWRDTPWPRQVEIASLVVAQVAPIDSNLVVSAEVTRGWTEGLKPWVVYRLGTVDGRRGPWITRQMSAAPAAPPGAAVQAGSAARVFDQSIKPGDDVAGLLAGAPGPSDAGGPEIPAEGLVLELCFEAGDHTTAAQQIRLVARPAVVAATAGILPPAYASGLVGDQSTTMDPRQGRVATVAALQWSTVEVLFQLNKPLPDPRGDWRRLFPGLAKLPDGAVELAGDPSGAQGRPTLALRLTLDQTLETAVLLEDQFGLRSYTDHLYRFEAVTDKLPLVAITEPKADESVLRTAVVPLGALAKDDVGVEWLRIEAKVSARAPVAAGGVMGTPAAGQFDRLAKRLGRWRWVKDLAARAAQSPKPRGSLVLREAAGRDPRLVVDHALDLATLPLSPGDEVGIAAAALDVFDHAGRRHEVVRSLPRRLRIIDDASLVGELRKDLAGLRQQVMRLDDKQAQAAKAASEQAQAQQRQVGESLARQGEVVRGLRDRMIRNRLREDALAEMLDRAGKLLHQADDASRRAATDLQQAAAPQASAEEKKAREAAGRAGQRQVADKLRDLATLLDQGRDALALQQQVRELKARQESLQADARKLQPRTLGQDADKLDADARRELAGLAKRQDNLADQAKQVLQQMQATAENIDKQGGRPQDKATAQALGEAAKLAQRQGLEQLMREAAGNAEQNQMAVAGQRQQEAAEVLDRMLQEMRNQDQRRQEILRRLAEKLADTVKQLIEQQRAQLAALAGAQRIGGLEAAQGQLRQNTMAAQDEAAGAQETAEAGDLLGQAVAGQGEAVLGLRGNQRPAAEAGEKAALASLEKAMEKLNAMQDKQDRERTAEERAKLREGYLRIAAQQATLRDEAAAMLQPQGQAVELNRRQKARLVAMAEEEGELRKQGAELAGKVGDTVMFKSGHAQLDRRLRSLGDSLGEGRADAETLFTQTGVVRLALNLADALKQDENKKSPFDRPEDPQGGGGGAKGPQPKPKLVPPVAELKALRGMQQSLLDVTRDAERLALPDAARQRGLLEQLGRDQRELHDRGGELIQGLQRKPMPMPLPPGLPDVREGDGR